MAHGPTRHSQFPVMVCVQKAPGGGVGGVGTCSMFRQIVAVTYCLHEVYFVSSYMRYFEGLYKLKSFVSTCDFVIEDVCFELSVAVVGVLTKCYPSRRYSCNCVLETLALLGTKKNQKSSVSLLKRPLWSFSCHEERCIFSSLCPISFPLKLLS